MTSVSVGERLRSHHQGGTASVTQELLRARRRHVQVQDALDDILIKQLT